MNLGSNQLTGPRSWAQAAAVGATVVVGLLLTVVIWLALSKMMVRGWPWQEAPGSVPPPAIDLMKVSLAVVAGVGGAVALVTGYRRQAEVEKAARRAEGEAREARILRFEERFGAAATQLGATSPTVRLAGVYALAALADQYPTDEYPGYRQQCVDVLCGYLRLTGPNLQSGELPRPELASGREISATVVSVIAAHLKDPGASTSWSVLDYDLTGACLVDVGFADCHFKGTATFDRTTFAGEASFRRARFDQPTSFKAAVFSGDTSFTEAAFCDTATFDNSDFRGDALFDSATFHRSAGFEDARFSKLAGFADATFVGETRFGQAAFDGRTSFNNAGFTGAASFAKAIFSSPTSFAKAEFVEFAMFSRADFLGAEHRFDEVVFGGGAFFGSTKFAGRCWFGEATFHGRASFESATFPDGAVFNDAEFAGATFDNARFAEYSSFSQATFHDAASFGAAEFRGTTLFGGANFHEGGSFDASTFARVKTDVFQDAQGLDRVSFARAGFSLGAGDDQQ
ncbi:MAG: pentapeptide repeat-containing protein [Nocardioides sp.]